MFASFNRFELQMTLDDAQTAAHQGECIEDVKALIARSAKLRRQLYKIPADDIRAELREYGAWDDEQLADDESNRQRIVWLGAVNIIEDASNRRF